MSKLTRMTRLGVVLPCADQAHVCNLARMSMNVDAAGLVPEFTLSDRLRKAREVRGLSQTAFAAQTGLSRSTIVRVESGEKVPGVKEYNLWQMATGVSREWLENGSAPVGQGPDGGGVVHPLGLEPRTHWLIDSARPVRHLRPVAVAA
jgi:transcriptional regulator with XRE-family HTH domain